MPPKKANTKAKATPAKATAAPATVTNSKGKEIDTTAAAGRPRREPVAPAYLGAEETSAPAKTKKATTTTKKAAPAKANTAKKAVPKATTSVAGKKRGRPANGAGDDAKEPPKKRGRPTNGASKDAPAVSLKAQAPPKKRGRPPKGGETTKIEADDEQAAEQLEEELVETAEAEGVAEEPSKRTSPTKKRVRPAKAVKGKGKAATTTTVDGAAELAEEEDDAVANGVTAKQYWLMKAEQEDREETLKDGSTFNAKFTIDDLREKDGPEPWDGVRNSTACKNMKDMKLGDLAFFYASGGKKGNVPGITGIMEVVRESEPDMSAFEEGSAYYVENAKMRGTEAKPRWFMVHVEFRKKLSKPVTLKELQKYSAEGGALSEMQEFKAARLSVSKVSEEEWEFIMNNLIEGYEDDAALPAATTNGDVDMVDEKMSNGVTITDAKETIESDLPTTDNTMLAAETAATSSRPASRAGSEKKTASRPGSRAGSLAPPRATSRGRSRTPRAGSAQPTAAEKMDVINE